MLVLLMLAGAQGLHNSVYIPTISKWSSLPTEEKTKPFLRGKRITDHWFMLPNWCRSEMEGRVVGLDLSLMKVAFVDGEIAEALNWIPHKTRGECTKAVCLTKGTELELISHIWAGHEFTGKLIDGWSISALSSWLHNTCQRKEIGWISYHPNTLKLYWLNPNGQKMFLTNIKSGEFHTHWRTSYLGHKFVLDDSATGREVGTYTCQHNGFYSIGTPPPIEQHFRDRDYTHQIRNIIEREWRRSNNIHMNFTAVGFKKTRVPLDAWASIQAYYHNNVDQRVREEWSGKGAYVNWWKADPMMIYMPWGVKGAWHRRILPLLEEWAGIDLVLSDIYGIRMYASGNDLQMHVDRQDTHVVSCIINVDQDVDSDWKLQIHDNTANGPEEGKHLIAMKPGDLVFYESAKAMHGRPVPIDGRYYTNMFLHSRPAEYYYRGSHRSNWYLRKWDLSTDGSRQKYATYRQPANRPTNQKYATANRPTDHDGL